MKRVLLALILTLTTSIALGFDAAKEFTTNCATCHTIGAGDKLGPDLAGLSKRRTVEWIVKFVSYPEGMIKGDPEEKGYEKADEYSKKLYELYKPQMMAEQTLDKAKVEALLKYIDSFNKQPQGKILQLIKK